MSTISNGLLLICFCLSIFSDIFIYYIENNNVHFCFDRKNECVEMKSIHIPDFFACWKEKYEMTDVFCLKFPATLL